MGGIFGRNPTFNDVTIEGTLTFDGAVDITTDLTIDGTLTANGLVIDTDTLYVNPTNNRVGVNTASPSAELHVNDPSGAAALKITAGGSSQAQLSMTAGGGAESGIFVSASNDMRLNANGGERMRIRSNGNVEIMDGDLIIGTSGHGIDFSATSGTGTSELFDDYEEGTWAPTVSSAAGTVTVTSTSGSTYTKIGRTVQVNASITMTTDASVGTSDLTIGGLPFAVVGGGTGNLSYSNWSSGDYGTGGAHGLVRLLGSNMFHVNRSIDISGRSSFGFIYYAVYTAS